MEEKDLMIGKNYQLDDEVLGGGICRINNVSDMLRASELLANGLINPIPISEEWLVKFGFEYNPIWRNYYSKEIESQDCLITIIYHSDYSEYHSNGITVKIKHVHQLQNLYFALTGEELTLKND